MDWKSIYCRPVCRAIRQSRSAFVFVFERTVLLPYYKLVDRVIGLIHFGNNLTILRSNQNGALAINHLNKGIICQILKAASGESKRTNRFSNGQSMAIEKPKISIITAIQNSLCQFLILYFSANLRRMLLKTTVISAMSKSIIRRRTSLYMIIFSPFLSSKCRLRTARYRRARP